jgi:aldehyde:ferredoxin oxidoreductase
MTAEKINGYNGQFLRVNLTDRAIKVEAPDRSYFEHYLGGRGFIAVTLLKETAAGCDPLGPGNKLIFAAGPMTGTPLPGGGRNSVGAKSPLTGGFGEAEAGGFFGAELRRSGFDAIIVEGSSESPVYLWIEEGKAEIRDARHLWGLETGPTHAALRSEIGDARVRTAVIGPGGERLIPFACILNDVSHAAGRTGLGAVMGAKKLKAIAARGKKAPEMADENGVKNLAALMAQTFKERTELWRYGTGFVMEGYSLAGNMPTYNFRDGGFPEVKKITAQEACGRFGIEMYGCYACPIRCKKRVKVDEPWPVDPVYGGPEYETLAGFGSNCGVSDLRAICKAHEICNRAGIDTISAAVTISWAMECFEKGILSRKDTGNLDLTFGNAEAMLKVLEQIPGKEGLGAVLSEGSRTAAQAIGNGAEEFAMHVKGLEIPMHDPRLKQGLGLHYAVNPAGADHCSGVHDTLLEKGRHFDEWSAIDVNEAIPTTEMSPRKARLVYQYGLWTHLPNHLGLCMLVPYTKREICQAVEAITGWGTSYWRLMKTAERGLTLAKIFNLREGIPPEEDRLPKRMGESQTRGKLQGTVVSGEELAEARKLYYQMLGWDERGIPTKSRLVELDIAWAEPFIKGRHG